MKIQITIETTEKENIRCLIAGWFKTYDEVLTAEDFREYSIGTEFDFTDIQNILSGSCLGELASENNIQMKVVG